MYVFCYERSSGVARSTEYVIGSVIHFDGLYRGTENENEKAAMHVRDLFSPLQLERTKEDPLIETEG